MGSQLSFETLLRSSTALCGLAASCFRGLVGCAGVDEVYETMALLTSGPDCTIDYKESLKSNKHDQP
jgi:hypothetical protein